ncbi:MAG TPA: hypothetical protein VM328_07410 [Fimbriimonadaceae bacterium]|nr:hypothetical protein [Fimbriimonadaceae bacterium]
MIQRLLSAVPALALAATALGQIPGLDKNRLPGVPGLDSILKKGPAITTSLPDAKFEAAEKDSFNPECKPLASLQRTPSGGFTLGPGAFFALLQSY